VAIEHGEYFQLPPNPFYARKSGWPGNDPEDFDKTSAVFRIDYCLGKP
jgi:hypothetical protein